MTEPKQHGYPSNPDYGPQSSDERMREAWTLLDHVKPGIIPDDVRAYLVGGIVGLISRYQEKARRNGT